MPYGNKGTGNKGQGNKKVEGKGRGSSKKVDEKVYLGPLTRAIKEYRSKVHKQGSARAKLGMF